jgi:hypothetical protein
MLDISQHKRNCLRMNQVGMIHTMVQYLVVHVQQFVIMLFCRTNTRFLLALALLQ